MSLLYTHIYNDIFDLAQGSVTKMENITCMMSSFLTLTGSHACLFFFLWHQYSSAQSFFIHINFIHVISVRFSKFKCLFLLLKLHNVDQKCIRWLTVTCHVCTVLFSQWCNGSKVGVHNVWPLKAHPVWWLSWIFQRQGHHTSLSALHCHIFFNHSYLIHSI